MQLHRKTNSTSLNNLQATKGTDNVEASSFLWTSAYHSWCHPLTVRLYFMINNKLISFAMRGLTQVHQGNVIGVWHMKGWETKINIRTANPYPGFKPGTPCQKADLLLVHIWIQTKVQTAYLCSTYLEYFVYVTYLIRIFPLFWAYKYWKRCNWDAA
jgi:hypothetical protein